MKSKFRHIALFGKYHQFVGSAKPSSRETLEGIAQFLHTQGCEVILEHDTAAGSGLLGYTVMTTEEIGKSCDLAIVVGGYNSSNTSHIVELCEEKLPTYFITSAKQLISSSQINHFNYHTQKHITTENYLQLNTHTPVSIILTSGASCPDSVIEEVLLKLLSFFEAKKTVEGVLEELER